MTFLRHKAVLIALAMAVNPLPAMAQGNGELDCMMQSYDAGQLAEMGRLAPSADFENGGSSFLADQVSAMAMDSLFDCFSKMGWSREQLTLAAFYEVNRLSEISFRASGMLTDEQLERFDATLASGDQEALWAGTERLALAGSEGELVESDQEEQAALQAFELGSGLRSGVDGGEYAGLLLGFMAMQRMAIREFSALSAGND